MITVQFNENEMILKDNEEIVFQDVLEREGNQYFLQFNRGEKCIRISEAKFNGWYVIPEPYDDKVILNLKMEFIILTMTYLILA